MASNDFADVPKALAPWSAHWIRQVFKASESKLLFSFSHDRSYMKIQLSQRKLYYLRYLKPPLGGMILICVASGIVEATNRDARSET